MKTIALLILVCTSTMALHVHADAYRWIDEKGNVHFGDRPPDKSAAEDISAQIDQQNVDESSATTKKLLEQQERRDAAIKTEQNQLDARGGDQGEQRRKACKEARRRLKILKGRVVFYDNDGREIEVTEKEREARATSVERQIAARCD